ncbi:unknown [Lachnospiraceae bacterium CAG:215]|nr:unknown [Lachnospiraceae bacterium CAG:215]
MCQIPLAALGLHQISVPAFLQGVIPSPLGSQKRIVRIGLKRSPHALGSCDRNTVIITGSALRRQKIIPFSDVVHMRSLGTADTGARIDFFPFADQLPCLRIDLLNKHTFKPVDHIDQIFFSVIVMEQRRIKSNTVQINRFGPLPPDVVCPNQIIMRIIKPAFFRLHIGKHEIKPPVIITQARRPYPAGRRVSDHIQLAFSRKRRPDLRPVLQIFRVKQLHSRPPLKRRDRNIVIIPCPDNTRVRAEPF